MTRSFYSMRALLTCSCLLAVLVSGCRSARREEPIVGRLQSSSPEIEQGKLVYMQKCHMCHPQGNGGLGPSLNDKPLPAFGIRTQVRRGFGAMPSLNHEEITAEELDNVIAYMKALRRQRAER